MSANAPSLRSMRTAVGSDFSIVVDYNSRSDPSRPGIVGRRCHVDRRAHVSIRLLGPCADPSGPAGTDPNRRKLFWPGRNVQGTHRTGVGHGHARHHENRSRHRLAAQQFGVQVSSHLFQKFSAHGWMNQVFNQSPSTALANVVGAPAMSVPLGHDPQSGLPIGVQFVGKFGAEGLLLGLAGQLQRELPWADRHPAVWAGHL
jgi:hypothetical protein